MALMEASGLRNSWDTLAANSRWLTSSDRAPLKSRSTTNAAGSESGSSSGAAAALRVRRGAYSSMLAGGGAAPFRQAAINCCNSGGSRLQRTGVPALSGKASDDSGPGGGRRSRNTSWAAGFKATACGPAETSSTPSGSRLNSAPSLRRSASSRRPEFCKTRVIASSDSRNSSSPACQSGARSGA